MSKQAKPPPPGDKAAPSAPPPPPAWRNWIWPIMIVVIFALFYLLPHGTPSTSLTYSQFLSDVNAGQVKTVQLASTSGGTSTGTLTNGKSFTVVVPPQAGQVLLTDLQQHSVQISSVPSGNGFGTSVLIFLITFGLPIVFFIWLFRRISKGAASGLQANSAHLLVKPRLRSLVTFNCMNLARPGYIGRFDCIFCMDVLPHFSRAQRISLLERLHLYLEPGGYLFLSQTEKLCAPNLNFRSETFDGYTFHRKPLAASAAYGR